MFLSDETLVTLMVCTRLALSTNSQFKQYGLQEWNKLVELIVNSPLEKPAALLGLENAQIADALKMEENEAGRLHGLISRGGALAIELDRLDSMGVWILTRSDPDYPKRFSQRLGKKKPIVIFGSGDKALLGQPGIAIVGSRDLDEAGGEFAEKVGNAAAFQGLVVYSGGARGVDQIAMKNSLEGRGYSVGVLAHSLVKQIKSPNYRNAIRDGNLTLITPYSPDAGFSAGNAMGRNKYIYCLADYGLVVSSAVGKGGTWGGAQEVIKKRWVAVFVRQGENVPEGNLKLIEQGCVPIPDAFSDWAQLREWLNREQRNWNQPKQMDMFAKLT